MVVPDTLQTDRLKLEHLGPDTVDIRTFYEICSADPGIEEVTRYTTWEPHETIDETAAFLERAAEERRNREAAAYVIRPREGEDGAGKIAGCTALTFEWDRRAATMGIWLRKRFWGRGYSGERAGAVLELAFEDLDLDLVAITHHSENEQSRAAVQRYVEQYGGRREGLLRHYSRWADEIVDEVRYTITAEEYRATME